MKPDRIQFAPEKSGWDLVGQKIDKTYEFDSFLEVSAFVMIAKTLADVHAVSAALDFHIFGSSVVIVEISRGDGGDLTGVEKTLAQAIDAVFELIDVAPAPEE